MKTNHQKAVLRALVEAYPQPVGSTHLHCIYFKASARLSDLKKYHGINYVYDRETKAYRIASREDFNRAVIYLRGKPKTENEKLEAAGRRILEDDEQAEYLKNYKPSGFIQSFLNFWKS